MPKPQTSQIPYRVVVQQDPDNRAALRFTFRQSDSRPAIGSPEPYVLSAEVMGDSGDTIWIRTPADEVIRRELEGIVRERLRTRNSWLAKVRDLVRMVKGWADELGWSSKVIDKKLDDSEIGPHVAPALLVQEGSVRLLLEPVARAAPGAEGVVDLYLVPAYDDVASIYFHGGRWHIHYPLGGGAAGATGQGAEAKPLTKATLRRVFDGMKAHAG